MNTISAQTLLNGSGFNDEYMLEKARRELDRIKDCRHPYFIYDHFINFAIAVSSVADWTFHLHLARDPKWNNKTEIHFCNWIRSQSSEVATFIDISNECNHANRKHPNFIAEKVLISPIWDTSAFPQEQINEYTQKGFSVMLEKGTTLLLVPIIKYGSKQDYFYDVAEKALAWWKALDLTQTIPMDKNLNPLS
ncbi:hypothetical protein [Methylomonas fluvii]|uniref:Uncharacterized protein n=1 Tax=Methylomonas fluvii TaxID=1854564 RepID=A0ABR9D961_9GAMM|nr:hypothetical protein [Methylomonas fluvii]MBD9359652.1 hypothetical protein [Methylomonas fluvii]CAD6872394.1 hypothetical protein [Methylomonas fluvii]